MKDRDFICHRPANEKDKRFAHDLLGIARDATELKPHWNMSHVMVEAGVFDSRSQAKKSWLEHSDSSRVQPAFRGASK